MTCHNARLKTGGLAIDQLDIANVRRDAETWEQVVRRLRVGAMPPRGASRPDATASNALISWLEGELDKSGTSNPGRPTLRRLNRAEYANAIRDLLALDVDVTLSPSRRFGVWFRQRRRCSGQFACAAAGVPRRGSPDQRGRCRRLAHRRRQQHLHGTAGSLAGRSPRRVAAGNGRRTQRHAHLSSRCRVRLSGPPLSHEPERDARARGSAGGGTHPGRRTDPGSVIRRRAGPDRAANQPDRHLGQHRSDSPARPPIRQSRASATSRRPSSRRHRPRSKRIACSASFATSPIHSTQKARHTCCRSASRGPSTRRAPRRRPARVSLSASP